MRKEAGNAVGNDADHDAAAHGADGPSGAWTPVLRPGDTCLALARADRVAVIVDAADYFLAVRNAMLRARRQIVMVAWDFDSRIKLDPNQPRDGVPRRLGTFLTWLVKRTPTLNIHVLKWRLSLFQAAWRGMTPLFVLDWLSDPRLNYRLAADHPVGACHHQKIVVIDDCVAFCGGIDMTADRWDTRAHLDHDPHRRRPSGAAYEPFHDTTMAVDGEAARMLGEIARRRWQSATGEALPTPGDPHDVWPDGLPPLAPGPLDVAIARTQPDYDGQPQVTEIERLWLSAIAAARRCLYIEAQYFASRRIGQALLRRLEEPDGPEIVVVNPQGAHGWLETHAMGLARDHMMAALRQADPAGRRFALYTPVTAPGRRIYVHSKVLIVDDRLIRVGSSNINNRSMGFDTECDLALEVRPGRPGADDLADAILNLRDGLVAEHLGCPVAALRGTLAETGSLLATIERLRTRPGRTLRPLPTADVGAAGGFLVEAEILDPERPRWPLQGFLHRVDWDWLRRRRKARSGGTPFRVGGGAGPR